MAEDVGDLPDGPSPPFWRYENVSWQEIFERARVLYHACNIGGGSLGWAFVPVRRKIGRAKPTYFQTYLLIAGQMG